jgi:hypothetical protein
MTLAHVQTQHIIVKQQGGILPDVEIAAVGVSSACRPLLRHSRTIAANMAALRCASSIACALI